MKTTDRTLEYLKWGRIVGELAQCAATDMGRELVRGMGFLPHEAAVRDELARVSSMKAVLDAGRSPDFSGITDVGALLHRATKEGTLSAQELVRVGDCLSGLSRIHRFLSSNSRDLDCLRHIARDIEDQGGLAHEIALAIDRDGTIREDASPTLRELRQRLFETHQSVKARLEDYLRSPQSDDALQEKFYTQREDRYVLPVRSERRNLLDGIVHAVSQSGATVFVEPQFLVGVNNRLKLLQEEVHREEFAVLKELSLQVAESAQAIARSLAAAAELDFVTARALLSVRMKAHAPSILASPRLALRQARSPILLLQGEDVVSNDIVVGDPGRVLVVSGPNAGGKSVALATCGQCVLLAHAGLHIPAGPDSELPVLAGLHALPGDLEDVERQLSTFSGHLQELNRVLASAEAGHLVLVDEITVGTEPVQGAALGAGYLLALADRGCLAVVATHYEQLKALAMSDPRFENASMGMDWERLAPTYRMVRGAPGSSRTFEIARRFNVPDAVMKDAERFFEGKAGSFLEDALRKLSAQEAEVAREAEAHRQAIREAEMLKRRRTLALESLGQQAARIIARKVKEALREVEEALHTVAGMVARLQKETPTHARLAETRRELEQVSDRIVRRSRELDVDDELEKLGPNKGAAVAEGMQVYVRKFKKKATVLSLIEEEGAALLKMGPMRMRLPLAELVPIEQAGAGAGSSSRVTASAAPESLPSVRLDLRGVTADEALDMVRKGLDDLVRSASGALVIVHGHGTGRLKAAVRSLLAETSYPVHSRPGKREEGGDGVTVVTVA
jgi:DNA mismatch repair protein MutS2